MSFPVRSLNTLGSFVYVVMLQSDKQTNKQTDRRHRTSYPRRPTESAWVITRGLYQQAADEVDVVGLHVGAYGESTNHER